MCTTGTGYKVSRTSLCSFAQIEELSNGLPLLKAPIVSNCTLNVINKNSKFSVIIKYWGRGCKTPQRGVRR